MRDERLSIEARGMLALLMTYADDWIFQRCHLMKVAQIKRDKFQRIMRELIEAGYVEREAVRAEGGKVAGSTWVIMDTPGNEPESLADQGKADLFHREPEKPVVGATEDRLNRQPAEPTAGKTGPLRRTNNKNTKKEECVCPDDEATFDRFWKVHPRPRDRYKTRGLFFDAIARGANAQHLLAAVEAYRHENEGNRSMYLCYSDNWLEQGRFKDAERTTLRKPPDSTPQQRTTVESTAHLFAQKIAAGKFVPPSALSTSLVSEMLARGWVTAAQLRDAGVNA
jgi:hypothetical protein